jgi:hypothetical protein
VRLARRLESDCLVERDGLRIGQDVDACGAALARNALRLGHESAPNTGAHPIRLDEQPVELTGVSGPFQQHSEADNDAVVLSDADVTRRDLFGGQLDRVWMRCQLRPVHGKVHRGAKLEPLQRDAFRYLGKPNRAVNPHAAERYPAVRLGRSGGSWRFTGTGGTTTRN